MLSTSDYKILVLDLDGTLTNKKKEITARTKETLIKAMEKGIIVVLASGRPTYGIVPLAEEIGLAKYGGYILSFNGGTIINWATKEVIFEKLLNKNMISPSYEMAKKHGVEIVSYMDQDIVTEAKENKYVDYEAFLNKMPVRQVGDFVNELTGSVNKCLIVGDADNLIPLEQIMKDELGTDMNIYRSEPFFLELVPHGIDKAASLNLLLERLSLTKEHMIACGDGYNDLSMIELAGLGVAMENANDTVKAAANYITLSNEEDGVAHVIEKYLL